MKKILALLLALCMLFAIAACGNADKKPDESKTPDASPSIDTSGDNEQLEGEPVKTDYVKDEVIVAEKTNTSLTPWGTNNGTAGVYSV